MKLLLFPLGILLAATTAVPRADAAKITLRHQHFLYAVEGSADAWAGREEIWTFDGRPILPAPAWNASGAVLPAGVERSERPAWNREAIAAVVREKISTPFDRPAGAVTISRASGAVVFDGVGMSGRAVDVERTVDLLIAAVERGIANITLPVVETPPQVTVSDPELRAMGIKELVTVGESDYSNSPANRIHNIKVGMAKFQGHLVPKDAVFSFVGVLGPVDGSTGYKKELVIKGDKTVPDYGGGLCQISSTAYRGVWEYGFPILQRRNHSFAVNHYAPQGTDATIYPGAVDMQFKNDGPGALLIQTHLDEERELAYYLYYGTRDDRKSEVVGPYVWGHKPAPPERIEYVSDLPPGQKRKVGEATPGMQTAWFRVLEMGAPAQKIERFHSSYQARPRYFQVGSAGAASSTHPDAPPVVEEPPSWIGD